MFARSVADGGHELWKAANVASASAMPGVVPDTPVRVIVATGSTFVATVHPLSRTTTWWNVTPDGTAAGTQPVLNLSPAQFAAEPVPLAALGGSLYFLMRDPLHGQELFRLTP